MSDLIKGFVFDLQRFAQFKGGNVPGEEGITLSKLFDSQGNVWKTEDAATLGNRTYFWENEDAKVSLTPATDNASKGSGITLVRGVYDDPVTLSTGKQAYGIQSVDAISAEGVTSKATFANLDGVTKIINPGANAEIDVEGDSLGAIKFSGTGTKTADSTMASLMGVAVGTVVSLDGSGNIEKVNAAAGEEITTADGTKATFKNAGTATFVDDSFNRINSFAKNGSAELSAINSGNATNATLEVDNVKTSVKDGDIAISARFDGSAVAAVSLNAASGDIGFGGSKVLGKDIAIQNKAVNVAGITATSEVIYNYVKDDNESQSNDVIDLTATKANGTVTVAKTGEAGFVVANDEKETITDVDISIGGKTFQFTDKGDNGGVFVVANNAVTGFVFRDNGDAITIKYGETQPTFYELKSSSKLSASSKSGKISWDDLNSDVKTGFKNIEIKNEDSYYTVTKTEDGYSVVVAGKTTITTDTGATITVDLPQGGQTVAPTAALNFNEDGKLESITGNPAGAEGNTGLGGAGATLTISGLTMADLAGDTLIIDADSNSEDLEPIEITANEDGKELEYEQAVDDKGETTIKTNQNGVYNIGGESYTVEGLSGNQQVTYIKDDEDNIIGLSGVTGTASVTGSFNLIYLNGETEEDVLDIDSAEEGTQYIISNNALTGLKDGDTVNTAATLSEFGTIEEGTFTILGDSVAIAGDSEVAFGVEDGALASINALSGTATGELIGLTVNGKTVEVTGDYDNIIRVAGNEAENDIAGIGKLGGESAGDVVDVVQAGNATQIGADSDGQFTFSFAGGETFTVEGNGTEETVFDLDSKGSVAAITGIDSGEVINGLFDNGIEVNGQSIAAINGASGIEVANVAGDLVISGLADGAVVSKADGVTLANTAEDATEYGVFTFDNGNQVITVSGDPDGVEFVLDGNDRVVGIEDLDTNTGAVGGDINGIKINGDTSAVEVISAPDGRPNKDLIRGNGTLSGIKDGDTVLSADHLETIHAHNGEVTFENGTFTVAGDTDNLVDFIVASGTSQVVGISAIDGTVTGDLYNISVNGGQALGIKETATTLGGDGVYNVAGNSTTDGIDSISGLGGSVAVTYAGGVSQLFTDDAIDLIDNASKEYKLEGNTPVTLDINENSVVKDIIGFERVPATLTIVDHDKTVNASVDGAYIEVFNDGDNAIRYETDGAGNYSLTAVDDGDSTGVSINAIGKADVVQTSGDGKYTFFGDQAFTLEGEGRPTELDAKVNYWVDDANRIRRINELDGNITGNFEEAITVNSADITNPLATDDVIQVLDDKEIVVSGDAKSTQPASVSAIDKVSDKASIVATGSATVVGTDTEGVFTFDNGVTDAKYTVNGDTEVKFLLDSVNTGLVYGVDSLVGTIVLDDDENTKAGDVYGTFIVNPSINDAITMVSANKVSLKTDANGKLSTIAGLAAGINEPVAGIEGVRDVTIIATEAIGVNGQFVDVTDADNSFQIVVDKNGSVTAITDVTGDATINLFNVGKAVVTTNKQGRFEIDKEFTFNGDSDGKIAMTLMGGTTTNIATLTAIESLDGAVIIDELTENDTTAATITVNGSAIEFNSESQLAVTVTTDGSSITAVNGLADLATIKGDLDIASIAVPGTTEINPVVEVTINNDPYTLVNDPNGVTINGARNAINLDEEGELIVGNAGTYTVNGHNQALVADTNDTIVGYDKGAYAEIFDADTVLIRGGNIYTDVIEYRLGLHKYSVTGAQAEPFDGGDQVGGPDYTRTSTDADPLSREETDSILADASTGAYDLDRPLEVYADNYDLELDAASRIDQDLNFSGTDFTKKVHLYRGDQNVTLNSFGGNEVLVEDVSGADTTIVSDDFTSGEKRITLGGGELQNSYGVGDVVIVDAANAIDSRVSITGGAGKDSVYVRNNIDVVFDMGGSVGGDDKLITYASSNARVSLENYDPINTKAGIQVEEPHLRDSVGGVASAVINDKMLKFGDGMLSVTTTAANGDINTAEIDFGDNSVIGGTLVYLYTPEGTRQGVGFTHSNGGSVDSSQLADDMILIGNKDGSKKFDSSVQTAAIWATVTGGVGNDTVLAGEGDLINAGDGNNLVSLENDSTRGGAEIVLNDGNTVIENTNNTFYADHGDTLDVDNPANISFNDADSNLIIRGKGYNATVLAPDHDSIEGATSTDTIGVNVGSTYVNQLVKDADGKVWKMAVGGASAVIDVKDDQDIRADYYKGGAVTFENYDGFGPVQVDLSNDENSWGSKIDGVEVKFDGVVSVEAGESDTTIKGSENNEWFFAGKGKSSLYGAGGKNLLVGYRDATDDNITKEGSTTFFVLGQADTGVNTIESFAFVNDNNYTNNSIVADMIEIDTANNIVTKDSVEISGKDIVFSVENRNTKVRESVLVKDAASSYEDEHVRDFRITESVTAQVADDDLYFDKFANFYMATGKNATVKVSNDQDYSKVWLANPALGTTFVGDIHVIDATGSSVTAELAGNDYNNSIYGGAGDTSLWGGNFGDDLLVGGTGKNTFYYALGNGADTIQGAKEGDVIDLTGVTIADVEAGVALGISKIDETGVSIGFATGGTLRVDGTAANVDYVVQGETYTLNEDRTLFVKKK